MRVLVLVTVLYCAGAASAGPLGLFRTRQPTGNAPAAAPAAGLWTAQAAANYQASLGRMGHYGNPSGGFEGVGCAMSAAAALANTCKPHNGPPRDWGVAQGRNGLFYACRRW